MNPVKKMDTKLRLLVIRANSIETTRNFYESIGIHFDSEKHGNGPTHFAAEIGQIVLEIYPSTPANPTDSSTRLGFLTHRLDSVIETMEAQGGEILQRVQDSPWGRHAVVKDPDGRKVDLYQNE